MIAVDTNVLVYAHRADSPFHDRALDAIESLAASPRPWAIAWPCAHEFFAVVTHPRIYKTATPIDLAFAQLRALHALTNLAFLAEADDHIDHLEPLALAAKVQGGAVHDARIAAICLAHGVSELWSADRDFSRFPALAVRNPLLGSRPPRLRSTATKPYPTPLPLNQATARLQPSSAASLRKLGR